MLFLPLGDGGVSSYPEGFLEIFCDYPNSGGANPAQSARTPSHHVNRQ